MLFEEQRQTNGEGQWTRGVLDLALFSGGLLDEGGQQVLRIGRFGKDAEIMHDKPFYTRREA